MWTDAILAYLHFLAILGVGAHLGLEFAWLRGGAGSEVVRRLARFDLAYIGALLAALVTGGLRLAYGAKGLGFYSANPVLYAKLGVFALLVMISLRSTFSFIRWAKQAKSNAEFVSAFDDVRRVRRLVVVELVLFTVLPLLGAMLARGIGS